MKSRSTDSFSRKSPRFKVNPKVLILCEDSKSSVHYFRDACVHYRVTVDVRVAHCGKTHPLGIVEEAVKQVSNYEEIYCVIDRDTHPSFDAAKLLAERHGGKVMFIPSFPCFEYWYLLHFGCKRTPYQAQGNNSPGDMLIKELKKINYFASYEKGGAGNVFQILGEVRLRTAVKNAKIVLRDAASVGEDNPSTTVHKIIERFESLRSPVPV